MLGGIPQPSADHKTGHTKSLAGTVPETSLCIQDHRQASILFKDISTQVAGNIMLIG